VEDRIAQLLAEYDEVKRVVADHTALLERRLQGHRFASAINESIAWIANQTEAASSTDIGADRQACELLLNKFKDFQQDIDTARGKRLDELAETGGQYVTEGHEQVCCCSGE
jgi:hypothetical protein